METLPEALGLSTKLRQRKTTKRGEELWRQFGSTSSSPQNAIPTQSLFLSFYSPRREGRYISLHHIYSLSFRTEIRLNFLSNECVLPRILTSADLYLTMYNTTKLVPMCKGRFTHTSHGFRLGTVFSTVTKIDFSQILVRGLACLLNLEPHVLVYEKYDVFHLRNSWLVIQPSLCSI